MLISRTNCHLYKLEMHCIIGLNSCNYTNSVKFREQYIDVPGLMHACYEVNFILECVLDSGMVR